MAIARKWGWIPILVLLGLLPVERAAALDEGAAAKPAVASRTPAVKKGAAPSPTGLTDREPTNAVAPGDFAIVALPDTQFYTAAQRGGLPAMFTAQTEWIISNRVSRRIVYVTLEGDISNDGNSVVTQWTNATNALYRLEDPARTGLPDGIPYGVAVGNHDTYSGGTGKFNRFFGTSHFASHRYYGGHYGTNNDSHFDLFSAGGQDFVVLSLTMAAGSDPELMRWANGVLQSNVNRRAIVVTHSLLNPAHGLTPAAWTPEGPPIFGALTNNPNLFLMLCGHRHGEGRRHESVAGGSRHVDVLLADYQDAPHGGDAFLRLLEFSPVHRAIRVKTYSPWTGQWSTNSDACFMLDWPARP
ncbi:MAG: metallophosphoesterase [Kiritimatiellaeota bacterium]|nr:metallophosphoesterase [Kiritimatiellota bacterium]